MEMIDLHWSLKLLLCLWLFGKMLAWADHKAFRDRVRKAVRRKRLDQ